METKIIDVFEYYGEKASYHFADDSCNEWGLADGAERTALRIFDAFPELHPEMRKVAKGFLWSLERKRPRKT